ncbi:hypothetical protein BJ508DRAFT_415264 [Ascobolus immersus RN42]|uniref:DRBM domain-containing protein n=1 Tax=Ascobolus immersus RN42 TaxID=1160509 RepID=A0A3N4I3A6_ASCIM|nr:hypothetical protein BJ508DRAFT_415264 [Ascobolus immersus RN42]
MASSSHDQILEPTAPTILPALSSIDDYLASFDQDAVTAHAQAGSPQSRERALSPSGAGYVAELHARLQALTIAMPTYEIEDDPKGNQRFRGTIFIDAIGMGEIEVEGVYPSKRKVKEELAREALQALEQAEKDGTLNKLPESTTSNTRSSTIAEPTPLTGILPPTIRPSVPLPKPAPVPVPVPVALSTTATTQNVPALMILLQKYGFQYAIFNVVADPPSSSLFAGSVTVPGILEGATTPPGKKFPSKKHAKEYLAGIALEKVKDFVKKKEAEEEESRKRKATEGPSEASTSGTSSDGPSPPVNDNVYTGLLNAFLINEKHPLPSYHEYQLGLQFSCELTLPPSYPCPPGTVFGDKTVPHRGKKQARNMAAKAAWEWLVAQGHAQPITVGVGVVPKKKAKGAVLGGDVQLTGNFVVDAGIVARHLGYLDPKYEVITDEHAIGMCDVTAVVERQGTGEKLQFPTLRNQVGKKKARAAMAEIVLANLVRMLEEKGGKVIGGSA